MAPHGQFTQPDHSKGDANTVGGYRVVHGRPAAFEGPDGFAYSVEPMAEASDDGALVWGGYLLFVRWARIGSASPEGHVESAILAHGVSEESVLAEVGALTLSDARRTLERLVADRHGGGVPARKWWDAMNADDND